MKTFRAHGEPDADVLRAFGERPARLGHQLLRVEPDLDPVVDEREEGRQREGGHEDGDETELEHHLEVLFEEPLVRDHRIVEQPARFARVLIGADFEAARELMPPGLQLTRAMIFISN